MWSVERGCMADNRGGTHATLEELEAKLQAIEASPRDQGVLELIVRRPAIGEREVLEEGVLDVALGLVGDTWSTRGARAKHGPHPDMQVNVMNARAIAAIAGDKDRWALAGDQLFVDLDISAANVPPGTRLAVGAAIIEVTAQPHTGCGKFMSRFGVAAGKFVNSPIGRRLQLRGINAKVVQAGSVRVGDRVTKLPLR